MPPSFLQTMKPNTAANKTKNAHVPKLRFKDFDSELIITKFDKVVESNLYGPRFNAEDYSETGNVKTIRGTDLGRDGEIKYAQVPLAKLDESTVANHKLLDGDIIMITTADCGLTGVFRKQEIDYLSSAYGVRIRLNEQGSPYYFKYFFQTRLAKKEINSFIRKATVANLPGSDILKIKLHLPSLPEQQKIASFLSAVDEKTQQLTRKKELLEQYKKGVMQQLFSGKLRFKDELGKAFPDWEWKNGNELFDSITDKNHNSDLPILAITQDMGAVPREMINYQMSVTESSIASYKVVSEGDFIISLRSFQGGIEFSNYKGICSPAYNILRPSSLKMHREFYKYYLKTPYYINQLQKKLEGIRDGKMISYKYFSEIKLPLPSVAEQQKIAKYLSLIEYKIESISKIITQTQTFKKGLLQQMFV